MFDEQPDGDPHGECAAEIHRLKAENTSLREQLAKAISDADSMTDFVKAACEDRKYFEEQASDRHHQFNRAEALQEQLDDLKRSRALKTPND